MNCLRAPSLSERVYAAVDSTAWLTCLDLADRAGVPSHLAHTVLRDLIASARVEGARIGVGGERYEEGSGDGIFMYRRKGGDPP